MPPATIACAVSTPSQHLRLDQSSSRFFTLPLELRMKTYQFVYNGLDLGLLDHLDPQKWCWVSKSQLEFVSKQIRRECLPVRRRNTILHTSDTALLKTQPNQILNATDAGAKAAMSALPRSITSTLTQLRVHLSKSIPAQEYNIMALPKLRTITFHVMLNRTAKMSDGTMDKPKHLLFIALHHTRASLLQQWPPEGLPANSVEYYLRVRINMADK